MNEDKDIYKVRELDHFPSRTTYVLASSPTGAAVDSGYYDWVMCRNGKTGKETRVLIFIKKHWMVGGHKSVVARMAVEEGAESIKELGER